MENLKEWVMTLSSVIVFGSLCEMILPTGNFQKYIRLVIGIILVLALMSPVYSFLKNDIPNEFLEFDTTMTYSDSNTKNIEEYQKEKIISLYKKKLTEKIFNLVSKEVDDFYGEIKVEVEEGDKENFGIINKIVLITDTEYDLNLKKNIKKIIANEYNVSEDKIVLLQLLTRENK